jgi:hypothetical protein
MKKTVGLAGGGGGGLQCLHFKRAQQILFLSARKEKTH